MNLVLEKKKCATKNKGTVKVMKVTKEKNKLLTQNSPKILDKKKKPVGNNCFQAGDKNW